MRVAQISDIHIRTFKYHSEYKRAFEDLYGQLAELEPDLIINTGDTVHSKCQISPELVVMLSEFLEGLAAIAPVHMILGNHDLNLTNLSRTDAISPVVNNLSGCDILHGIRLHTRSGPVYVRGADGGYLRLWVYSLLDQENYPRPWEQKQSVPMPPLSKDQSVLADVGLFHGAVANCVIDPSGFKLKGGLEVSAFDGLDFVMMGDIHQRQQMDRAGRIRYPGSLIQQNFGEEPTKGFLLWDIRSRDDFDVTFHEVTGGRNFYTLSIDQEGRITCPYDVKPNSRLRVVSNKSLTLVEQRDTVERIRETYQPFDVVSVTTPETNGSTAIDPDRRDVDYEAELASFLKEKGVTESDIERVLELDRRLGTEVMDDEPVRDVQWKVRRIAWSNVFKYGEMNHIDLTSFSGLTGVFAANSAGKSTLFEVMLQGIFDKVTKNVTKNIDVINDNKQVAKIVVELEIAGKEYIIERTIERTPSPRVGYKDWGRTGLDFYVMDGDEKVQLNAELRSGTEKEIRRLVGSFEDFVTTSLSAQKSVSGVPGGSDLVDAKESDRKRVLYRFLGLDAYEKKAAIAKEELKAVIGDLTRSDPDAISTELQAAAEKRLELDVELGRLDLAVQESKNAWSAQLRRVEHTKALLERLSDVQSLTEQVRDISGKIEKLELDLSGNRLSFEHDARALGDLQEKLAGFKRSEWPDLSAELKQLESESTALSEASRVLSADLADRRKQGKQDERAASRLSEVPCGTQFPTCPFIKDAVVASDRLRLRSDDWARSDEQRLAGMTARGRELTAEIGRIRRDQDEKSEYRALEKRIEERTTAHQSHGEFIEKLEGMVRSQIEVRDALLSRLPEDGASDVQQLVERLKGEQRTLKQFDATQSSTAKQQLDAISRLKAIEIRQEQLQANFASATELLERQQVYRWYLDAVGKNGVPYRLLRSFIPLINDEVNRIISNVAGFSLWLEADEDDNLSLYVQYDQYRRRNVSLCGGAESFISTLALRAALLNISRLPRCNVFVIDEGFGKLDAQYVESVQLMFDYLKTRFEHVFIISHVDTMKDMVDNNIEISSDAEGYAHVEF